MAKDRKIKVLVVDNERGFASLLVDHLNLRKMEAAGVFSGEDALSYVAAIPVDVMILDLRLPEMSGLDVLAQVKRLTPAVEVVLLTGNGSFDTAIACMQQGAFDYLLKPVDLEQLSAAISGAYRKKRGGG